MTEKERVKAYQKAYDRWIQAEKLYKEKFTKEEQEKYLPNYQMLVQEMMNHYNILQPMGYIFENAELIGKEETCTS